MLTIFDAIAGFRSVTCRSAALLWQFEGATHGAH